MDVRKILIIDDEEGFRTLLTRIISLEGYEVYEAGTLKSALEILKLKRVDIILCDVKLPDGNGVEFIKEIKVKFPVIQIILLTAYGNIHDGVQAMKNGAFDYLNKGDDNDCILPLLLQATEKIILQKNEAVQATGDAVISFSSVIGSSPVILQTVALAKKIAPANTTVLLLGETGTGKEVFARAIHTESKRSTKQFIAINCSSFTKDLLEGELFGYKAGAYTGAVRDKKGLIELAEGGTLFLDEIGELNIDLQARLLRVLENKEFIKLGDIKTTKVDVRIIAATNRTLRKEVAEGYFREDLYYRLNTFTISLPTLRERKEDIEALASYFLNMFCEREGKRGLQLAKDTIQVLKNYFWKGNIRELRNVMERAVILSGDQYIIPQDLPPELQQQNADADTFLLADVEKRHIRKILQYTANNKTKAAQLLGIGVATLYRKLEEYGLEQ